MGLFANYKWMAYLCAIIFPVAPEAIQAIGFRFFRPCHFRNSPNHPFYYIVLWAQKKLCKPVSWTQLIPVNGLASNSIHTEIAPSSSRPISKSSGKY